VHYLRSNCDKVDSTVASPEDIDIAANNPQKTTYYSKQKNEKKEEKDIRGKRSPSGFCILYILHSVAHLLLLRAPARPYICTVASYLLGFFYQT